MTLVVLVLFLFSSCDSDESVDCILESTHSNDPSEVLPSDASYYILFEEIQDSAFYTYKDGNYTNGYISELVVNSYGTAPLTAILRLETRPAASVAIKVKGQDDYKSDVVQQFPIGIWHKIPILGLYSGDEFYINEVEISVNNENKTIKIQTDVLDERLPRIGIAELDEDLVDEGMNLIEYMHRSVSAFNTKIPTIYDNFGKIRWYGLFHGGLAITRTSDNFFRFGCINEQDDMPNMVCEYDILGQEVYSQKIPEQYEQIHHDITHHPVNGHLLITVHGPDEKFGTTVIEMDRTGDLVRSWDVGDIINNAIGDNDVVNEGDNWFHNNAIWFCW